MPSPNKKCNEVGDPMLLENKVAIVTGVTRGIGKAVLCRFAEEGARVVGVYRSNDDAASQLASLLRERGLTVEFYKGSVTDRSFVSDMVRDVMYKYGRIDILVNNAGVVRDQLFTRMSLTEWDEVYGTNFLGTYLCTIAVLPHMERQGSGNVVSIVSITGVFGREAQANYGASKGSIIGLMKLLGRKYAEKGIRFNAVAPGLIDTDMLNHVPGEMLDHFLRFTSLKRLGKTEEVAETVLFLASDRSSYFSNDVVKIDGGFMR